MSRALRVGVIGCGGIAQMMHLPHLAERPDLFEIAALCDVRADALEAVGRRYHVSALYADPRKVISHPEVEAVLLCASGSHRELARAALEAGKHLLVEKPLGYGLGETEDLVAAARASAGKLLVGYHKRFDPSYLRARQLVNLLGGLRLVEVTVLHPDDGAYRGHHAIFPLADPSRPPPTEAEDRASTHRAVTEGPLASDLASIAAPGAPVEHRVAAKIMSESLIHDLNVVRGVVGEPEEVLSAHTWMQGFAQTSVTRFAGDVHATLTWLMVPGLRNYEERVRFVGSDWRVTLLFPSAYLRNLPTPLLVERMDGGDLVVEQRTVSYEEAFRAELHAFRTFALEGGDPEPSAADALADARWIQAITRALAGGQHKVER